MLLTIPLLPFPLSICAIFQLSGTDHKKDFWPLGTSVHTGEDCTTWALGYGIYARLANIGALL